MRYCPNPDCPHAEATGSAAEYRDDVSVCVDCGSGLVDADELASRMSDREARGAATRIVWKPVPGFRDPVGIQLARTILDVEGIPCILSGVGLLVPEDRLTETVEILARDRSEEVDSLEGFPEADEEIERCPRCTSSGVTRSGGRRRCLACNHRW
jgi:hypothetical protein